jgi:hypothetical protein
MPLISKYLFSYFEEVYSKKICYANVQNFRRHMLYQRMPHTVQYLSAYCIYWKYKRYIVRTCIHVTYSNFFTTLWRGNFGAETRQSSKSNTSHVSISQNKKSTYKNVQTNQAVYVPWRYILQPPLTPRSNQTNLNYCN